MVMERIGVGDAGSVRRCEDSAETGIGVEGWMGKIFLQWL